MLLQKIYQKIAKISVNSSNVLLKPIIYINKDPTNSRQWFNDSSFWSELLFTKYKIQQQLQVQSLHAGAAQEHDSKLTPRC